MADCFTSLFDLEQVDNDDSSSGFDAVSGTELLGGEIHPPSNFPIFHGETNQITSSTIIHANNHNGFIHQPHIVIPGISFDIIMFTLSDDKPMAILERPYQPPFYDEVGVLPPPEPPPFNANMSKTMIPHQ